VWWGRKRMDVVGCGGRLGLRRWWGMSG